MPTSPDLLDRLVNNDDPDARVLAQMVELGADLSLPHVPEFAFDAAEEAAAMSIAHALAELDFDVRIFGPEDDAPTWQVVAARRMIPDLDALMALSAQFEALAKTHGVVYDGWGAEIVD
jgi:hypothetical protein